MARSMLNLDLGFSDDDEPPSRQKQQPGRGSKVAKDESVSDLIGGRDPTLMFGGGSSGSRAGKRQSHMSQFDLSGGGDPLDMLKDSFNRHQAPPMEPEEPEMDDEELRFQMEFQREMGLLGGGDDDPPSRRGGYSDPPSRRRTPDPYAHSAGGEASDESLADIVGDILDDTPKPKKASPVKRASSPAVSAGFGNEYADPAADRTPGGSRRGSVQEAGGGDQRSTPGSRRGSVREDSMGRGDFQGDESPLAATRQLGGRPPRAGSRPPVEDAPTPRGDDHSPIGGDYEQEHMPRGPGRGRENSIPPSYTSDREGSVMSDRSQRGNRTQQSAHMGDDSLQDTSLGGRGGRRKPPAPPRDDFDPLGDILGDDGGGRPPLGRAASPAMGSGVESRGSTTPTGRGGTPNAESSQLYMPRPEVAGTPPVFDVELNVKPKRKLGMAKAKASPAPSTMEEDVPSRAGATPTSGRATPAGRSSTPIQDDEITPHPSRFGEMPSFPQDDRGPTQHPPSPPASLPEDDDDEDLDDLLPDETPAHRPVQRAPEPPKDDSDSELPDFMKRGTEQRLKRSEQSNMPAPAPAPRAVPKQSFKSAAMGADLGLSAEDLEPSDQSASLLGGGPMGAAMGASGSGSDLLDVPLSIKPKGGRRLPKAKAKGAPSSLEDDLLGSSHSASGGAMGLAQHSSPAQSTAFAQLQRGSPAQSMAHSASPSAAQSGSAHAPSKGPSSVPAASSEPGSAGLHSGHAVGYGYGSGVPSPGAASVGITGAGFQVSSIAGGPEYLPTASPPVFSPPAGALQGRAISPRHQPAMGSYAASLQGASAGHAAVLQGVVVPSHPGMDSAPPSDYGAVPGLPMAALPRSLQPADGLPPGSPLTQTAQSEGGSLQARHYTDQQQGYHAAASAHSTMAHRAAMAAGSPLQSDARRPTVAGGGGTPGSEPVLSLFGNDPMQPDHGGRAFGGFAAYPPLAAAPSADLLSKLAYSEAKVQQLELQLEDCDQRWVSRLADAKQQSEAEHERKELQCHKLEAELDRSKEMNAADLRHLNEKKQLMLQNSEMEKDHARREERRKAALDLEKLRADHTGELDELRRRHERSLSIAQQQADMEAENLRAANSGEQQLAKLVEQVQGSVAEVERMSRRADSDKSLEWSVRERQLEAREKTVREMESRLSAQSKEVEDQRRRVSELVRHMEDSQVDDRDALKLERERLQDEHARLLALQQSVRDADRNNKEALKHAWAQLEDEKHSSQQDRLRIESELQSHREETELMERQQRQETERLKALHNQVEVARQNASRRIRETEATIASERRALMSDLEVFEEKRRIFAAEVQKVEDEKQTLSEDRGSFENEVKSVGQMAAEVQRRSEELRALHDQAGAARGEILGLRDQLSEERCAHGSELERLKTMQTLVEQQRLQLLQTENQLRVRGIEDIEIMATTQATFPAEHPGQYGGGTANPFEAFGFTIPAAGGVAFPQEQPMEPYNMAAATPMVAQPMAGASWAGRGISNLGNRFPATPGVAGSVGHRLPGGGDQAGGSRMELQTLLRRTKEASGDVLYIQEQFRVLQQSQPAGSHHRDERQPHFQSASMGMGGGGFGGGAAGSQSRLRPQGMLPAGMPQGMLTGGMPVGMTSAGTRGMPGHFNAMLAPSRSTSTDDDDDGHYASRTLEGIRPLSSDVDLTSGGSGY